MALAPAHPQSPIPAIVPQWRPVRHLMRGVWLQALRRNEIYVVAILLALYLVGALLLRIVGIDSAQTSRFIAGLGLELGSMLSSLLVIVMGARQIPVELEQRTIYPVLAKPVTRAQLLLGKGLPTAMLGGCAMLLFALVTLAVTPRIPDQQGVVLIQALVCKTVALTMLTALVFWLALWLPSSLSMLLGGVAALLGTVVVNWLAGLFAGGWLAAGLIPDFKLFEQFSRYVEGGGLIEPAPLAGLLLYGLLWSLIFSGLTLARFRRQHL